MTSLPDPELSTILAAQPEPAQNTETLRAREIEEERNVYIVDVQAKFEDLMDGEKKKADEERARDVEETVVKRVARIIIGGAIILALSAGAAEIMRVLGASLHAKDGSDSFFATWTVLATAVGLLVLAVNKLRAMCHTCYVDNVYNNDTVQGPDASVYLNLPLSSDQMLRYTQVDTLMRATRDFQRWGHQAVQLQGTAASLNLVINLCGALVPTLIAFSGLYPEIPMMKRTCDVSRES